MWVWVRYAKILSKKFTNTYTSATALSWWMHFHRASISRDARDLLDALDIDMQALHTSALSLSMLKSC